MKRNVKVMLSSDRLSATLYYPYGVKPVNLSADSYENLLALIMSFLSDDTKPIPLNRSYVEILHSFDDTSEIDLSTMLFESIKNNDYVSANELLRDDSKTWCDVEGNNLLLIAVKASPMNPNFIEKLLSIGTDPRLANYSGESALSYVKEINNEYLVDLFNRYDKKLE